MITIDLIGSICSLPLEALAHAVLGYKVMVFWMWIC